MDSIRTVRIHEHGGLDALAFSEQPRPIPGPGQVRVRLGAMALNHLDLWVRRGVPGARFPLPIIPGSDGAGWIDELGEGVEGPARETPVFVHPGIGCGSCARCLAGQDNLCRDYQILGESGDGTSAEAIVVPAHAVSPIPPGLSMETAAAFPLSFLTAYQMLVHKARVQPGDRVLIHAAASGVSSAGIQIARHLGALVVATASRSDKLDLARKLGADHVVNYRETDWVKEVRDWAGRDGIGVVFDHVGTDTFLKSMRTLGRGGRYVFCGASSGFELKTDFRHVFFKNHEILGSTMGRSGDLARIARLIAGGRMTPVIDRVFPFEEIAAAHDHLEKRESLGKVVVRIAAEN